MAPVLRCDGFVAGRSSVVAAFRWSASAVCRFNVFGTGDRQGRLEGKGRAHHFAPPADNNPVMRRLLWTLASTDCLAATWLVAAGKRAAARRLIARAGELLDTRSRSRDDEEPWKPILGARRIGRQ